MLARNVETIGRLNATGRSRGRIIGAYVRSASEFAGIEFRIIDRASYRLSHRISGIVFFSPGSFCISKAHSITVQECCFALGSFFGWASRCGERVNSLLMKVAASHVSWWPGRRHSLFVYPRLPYHVWTTIRQFVFLREGRPTRERARERERIPTDSTRQAPLVPFRIAGFVSNFAFCCQIRQAGG
jgi:hypothetical protein